MSGRFRNNKMFKKLTLVFSLLLIVAWAIVGAGASLAWFSDTSEEITNIFHVADFDLEVSHRLTDGTWESIDSKSNIFDKNALYEPGYIQVVYLKVENKGTVPFDFYTAVSVTNNNTPATNVFGQQFYLQDYLKFGIAVAGTEQEMKDKVSTRQLVENIATMKLNNYSMKKAALDPKNEAYIALVVRMPEEVGNEVNYRGNTIPKVDLGIIVKADQQR